MASVDPDRLSEAADLPAGVTRREVLAGAATVGVTVTLAGLLPGCATAHKTEARLAPPAPDTHTAGTVPVSVTINDKPLNLKVDPRTSLLDTLREDLALTGTKKGCDHGQCGACTVLVNGRRVNSCLTLACTLGGKQVVTVEGLEGLAAAHGLAGPGELHPVQQAFIDQDAFQCGYCTPGQICSAVSAINEGRLKTDDDIREQMSGNICRCGAYPNIVDAVRDAQSKMTATNRTAARV